MLQLYLYFVEDTFDEITLNRALAQDIKDLVSAHVEMMRFYNWPKEDIVSFARIHSAIKVSSSGQVLYLNKEWSTLARKAQYGFSQGRATGFISALYDLISSALEEVFKEFV